MYDEENNDIKQPQLSGTPADILFWSHANGEIPLKTIAHFHCYWQLEIIIETPIDVKIDGKMIHLKPFCALVIPPESSHEFCYPDSHRQSWSFKFNLNHFPEKCLVKVITSESVPGKLTQALVEQINTKTDETIKEMAGYMIPAIINSSYNTTEKDSAINTLAATIKEEITKRNGGKLAVAELAQKLRYTRGHLSYIFQKENGIPIKQFIDQERATIAKRLLAYSDYNISEIADLMEFPDVYNFSRFFKRLTTDTPSAYRMQHIQRENRC